MTKHIRGFPWRKNADYRRWNMAFISCFSVDDHIWATKNISAHQSKHFYLKTFRQVCSRLRQFMTQSTKNLGLYRRSKSHKRRHVISSAYKRPRFLYFMSWTDEPGSKPGETSSNKKFFHWWAEIFFGEQCPSQGLSRSIFGQNDFLECFHSDSPIISLDWTS